MYREFKNQTEDKMAASKLKFVMFLGSVREGRMGLRVAKFIQAQLKPKHDVTLFDPEEIQIPLLKKPLHFYKDRSEVPKYLLDCESKLKEADGFIIVSAEYNHSIPPALSNMLDHFGSSIYSNKPSGIVCYSLGPYGGMRAAMQLRPLLSELGTLSVSNIFGIPNVDKSFDEDGKPLSDRMVSGLEHMMAQLEWHSHAMKNHRDKVQTQVASSKLKLVMFLGSVREGRMGLRVAKFIQAQLQSKYDVTLFDPEEIQIPLLKKPLHHYRDRSEAPKYLLDCESKLKEADGFIIVSAEYNHGIPPALSNMLDHFGSSVYSYKPSGIVCYSLGPYGGMRAAMQLRPLLSELGTLSVSNIFGIPNVDKSFDEDGKPLSDRMVSGLERMMAQLEWHSHAMKNHREKVGVPK